MTVRAAQAHTPGLGSGSLLLPLPWPAILPDLPLFLLKATPTRHLSPLSLQQEILSLVTEDHRSSSAILPVRAFARPSFVFARSKVVLPQAAHLLQDIVSVTQLLTPTIPSRNNQRLPAHNGFRAQQQPAPTISISSSHRVSLLQHR
jgi:hypothetical protein